MKEFTLKKIFSKNSIVTLALLIGFVLPVSAVVGDGSKTVLQKMSKKSLQHLQAVLNHKKWEKKEQKWDLKQKNKYQREINNPDPDLEPDKKFIQNIYRPKGLETRDWNSDNWLSTNSKLVTDAQVGLLKNRSE